MNITDQITLMEKPLTFYVNKLKNGETFSLSRFGDGEIHCMLGEQGKNCDGCDYRPDLAEALRNSLSHTEPDYYYGLGRVLPTDAVLLGNILRRVGSPVTQWVDSGVIAHAVWDGEFYPLLEQLRKMAVVIISNKDVAAISPDILKYQHFIEVPHCNTWEEKDRVINDIMLCHTTLRRGHPTVYLFSCGMTSSVLVSELHGNIRNSHGVIGRNWLIDIGHVWDAFIGKKSRSYMQFLTQEKMKRNLEGFQRTPTYRPGLGDGTDRVIHLDNGWLEYRYAPGNTCEIVNIEVSNYHRREGVGRELVNQLIKLCEGKAQLIYAFTQGSNRIAHDFYRGMGFDLTELTQFYEPGRKGDAFIVTRRIS